MKTDIHPTYNDTGVRCSCGNTFTTKSTVEGDLTVELCNECGNCAVFCPHNGDPISRDVDGRPTDGEDCAARAREVRSL